MSAEWKVSSEWELQERNRRKDAINLQKNRRHHKNDGKLQGKKEITELNMGENTATAQLFWGPNEGKHDRESWDKPNS